MADSIIQVADNFWNIRGSFKIALLVDVGTQASLVRLASGKFVFLDAYTFSNDVADEIAGLTNDGADIEAILNLHPFHTVHVKKTHARYPEARLYGTARHIDRFPDLPWEDETTDAPELHAQFAPDLKFSVPRGVDFISANENVHFSSVLALHAPSRTIHSDDTFNYVGAGSPLRLVGMGDTVSFHPTLAKALQKRAGAAQEFRNWAGELIEQWRSAENLCAAHTSALLASENTGESLHERLINAFEKTATTLEQHERRHG